MSTDDRIEESMRGMDRGDLLLGVDPTDMIRAFAGIPAGLDDDGNLALGLADQGWFAALPTPDPEGMFDMNFGSAVDGQRSAMMFGSSMNIHTAARDTFGLIGSDTSVADRGRGTAAATAVRSPISKACRSNAHSLTETGTRRRSSVPTWPLAPVTRMERLSGLTPCLRHWRGRAGRWRFFRPRSVPTSRAAPDTRQQFCEGRFQRSRWAASPTRGIFCWRR